MKQAPPSGPALCDSVEAQWASNFWNGKLRADVEALDICPSFERGRGLGSFFFFFFPSLSYLYHISKLSFIFNCILLTSLLGNLFVHLEICNLSSG